MSEADVWEAYWAQQTRLGFVLAPLLAADLSTLVPIGDRIRGGANRADRVHMEIEECDDAYWAYRARRDAEQRAAEIARPRMFAV